MTGFMTDEELHEERVLESIREWETQQPDPEEKETKP